MRRRPARVQVLVEPTRRPLRVHAVGQVQAERHGQFICLYLGSELSTRAQVYTVPGEDLMRRGSYFPDVPASSVLALEGVANRDSMSYAGTYGLGPVQGLQTLIRGTLRYVTAYSKTLSDRSALCSGTAGSAICCMRSRPWAS